MALLCPVTEFLKRVDASLVSQLVADPPNSPVAVNQLANDPNLNAELDSASGVFQGTVTALGRYSNSFLLNLAAGTDNPSQALMFQIVTMLTLRPLYSRKPQLKPDQFDEEFSRASWQMEAIKLGDIVLNS